MKVPRVRSKDSDWVEQTCALTKVKGRYLSPSQDQLNKSTIARKAWAECVTFTFCDPARRDTCATRRRKPAITTADKGFNQQVPQRTTERAIIKRREWRRTRTNSPKLKAQNNGKNVASWSKDWPLFKFGTRGAGLGDETICEKVKGMY